MHVYDITGELENEPGKVGYWNIDDDPPDRPTRRHRCTAHVFDIHEDEKIMTIAYYNGGVRVVDLSGLAGISLGGTQLVGAGMKEIGFYRVDGARLVGGEDAVASTRRPATSTSTATTSTAASTSTRSTARRRSRRPAAAGSLPPRRSRG